MSQLPTPCLKRSRADADADAEDGGPAHRRLRGGTASEPSVAHAVSAVVVQARPAASETDWLRPDIYGALVKENGALRDEIKMLRGRDAARENAVLRDEVEMLRGRMAGVRRAADGV